ncbi:MAG: L,D-transpeptidase [Erysipelotrichales bacterium]|nr:L,D-transpeptidase [Erysipelotrichales bacterium]
MKKKISKKFLTMVLISLLNSSIYGCGQKESQETENINKVIEETIEDNVINLSSNIGDVVENNITESKEVIEEEIEEVEEEKTSIVSVPIVIANEKTEILDGFDGNKLGYLPDGKSLELLGEYSDEGYYQVKYYDNIAYVNQNDVTIAHTYDIKGDIKKVLYATEDTSLIIPEYLSASGEDEEVPINKLECFEVYKEIEDYYLVQTADYIGYIEKNNVEELTGTFIVVDISDQRLILYKDNGVYKMYPVVTGLPTKDRATSQGLFEIYNITYNRDLIGQNDSYHYWIDIMMKFHGNEGFHNANYRTNENGKSYGSRHTYDFGGDTYTYNGSHGCVNMIYEDVMELSEYVGNGTAVLIKQ